MLVPYGIAEIFEVVSDVASYQTFLPNCETSAIIETTATSYDARLELAGYRMTQVLVTRNTPIPLECIKLEQLEGPFTNFTAEWRFKDLGEGCRVSFDMTYELKHRHIGVVAQPMVQRAIEKVVDAFVQEVRRRHD